MSVEENVHSTSAGNTKERNNLIIKVKQRLRKFLLFTRKIRQIEIENHRKIDNSKNANQTKHYTRIHLKGTNSLISKQK